MCMCEKPSSVFEPDYIKKEKKKKEEQKKRTIDNIDHSILLYTRHELPDSQENDTLAAEDMFYFKFIQRIM